MQVAHLPNIPLMSEFLGLGQVLDGGGISQDRDTWGSGLSCSKTIVISS